MYRKKENVRLSNTGKFNCYITHQLHLGSKMLLGLTEAFRLRCLANIKAARAALK